MEDKKEIYTAIAKARSEMQAPKKTSINSFYKSKYSDLADVSEAIKAPLANNGLFASHDVGSVEGGSFLMVTTLCHSSGQSMSNRIPMYIDKKDAQSVGKALSYYKRYGLQALLALPSEDDDGEAAMNRIPDNQLAELKKLIGRDKELEDKILKAKKITKLKELKENDFEPIKKRIVELGGKNE